jgi:hypothetical protein
LFAIWCELCEVEVDVGTSDHAPADDVCIAYLKYVSMYFIKIK